MAYEIRIKRQPALSLEEWTKAISRFKYVRLNASGTSIRNPHTGEVITIAGRRGDAEVFVAGKWRLFFRWQNGTVVFKPHRSFNEPKDKITFIAKRLAQILNAKLVGDEGEIYD